MSKQGILVISVPVEVYMPALFKGIFRMIRRYGAFDANIKNILKCLVGKPPKERPRGKIENELLYYYDHLGFDYRVFGAELAKHFKIISSYGGPFMHFPLWANFEKYFICRMP